MSRMTDEEIDALERELSSDNESAATPLAAEARRARESEKRLVEAAILRLQGGHQPGCAKGIDECDCGQSDLRHAVEEARAALKQVEEDK